MSSTEELVDLATLRKNLGLTQIEVSLKTSMSQESISRFERGGDHLISKLADYVAALGGTLEVIAVIGEKRYHLVDVG
jgi:transcriptional regulator with XRE-family HTH domain